MLDSRGQGIDELWSVPNPTWPPERRLDADGSSRRVAIAGIDHLLVVDADGRRRRIDHPAWNGFAGGCAAFDPSHGDRELLWLVRPSEAVTRSRQPPSGVVELIDASTGELVDGIDLEDGFPEGYTMVVATRSGVLLTGHYGQEGPASWCLRSDGPRFEIKPIGATGTPSAFDGATEDVLFTNADWWDLHVRSWWGDHLRGRSIASTIFGDEVEALEAYPDGPDGFSPAATFLGEHQIVAGTWAGPVLVLDRRTGALLARLDIDLDERVAGVSSVAPGVLLVSARDGSAVLVEVEGVSDRP